MAYVQVDLEHWVIRNGNLEAQFSSNDYINPESWTRDSRMPTAFVVLNAGYVLGIVFPEYYGYSEQDALDEMADRGKLDAYQVSESELADYQTGVSDEGYPEYEGLIHLGNASEPFDLESLDIWRVRMSEFEQDSALMTADRVLEYLKDQESRATDTYRAVTPDNVKWSELYRIADNYRDAVTLVYQLGCKPY